MANETLFTLPIPSSSSAESGGTIVCTRSSPGVYLLTFTAPPDNRLITPFCQTFLLALDILEFSYPPGVLITTSGIGKFYSNGLNLEHASSTPGYWSNTLFALWKRLLTYHMPTVAWINGHAFAGGLMFAMYHDYRIFNPSRGFLCLNELDMGAPLKPPMSSIFRQKVPPATYRSLVLEAKRFPGPQALEAGIVDGLGALPEVLAFVEERKLADKPKSGVYSYLRREMYRESLQYLETHEEAEARDMRTLETEEARESEGKKRVAEWRKNAAKSKL